MHQKNSCFKTQKTPETLDFTGFPVFFSVKLEKGLEPSTPSLRVKCSTD